MGLYLFYCVAFASGTFVSSLGIILLIAGRSWFFGVQGILLLLGGAVLEGGSSQLLMDTGLTSRFVSIVLLILFGSVGICLGAPLGIQATSKAPSNG